MNTKMNMSKVPQRCPKCSGNLFLFNDYEGWYEQCMQCSYILYLDLVHKVDAQVDSNVTSKVN